MVALGEELDLVRAALPEFDLESFNAGHLTPVYFGSAIKEIGVADLLDALAEYGPPPRAQIRRYAHRGGDRGEIDRAGVQDPGQHGPQPSRPHRVRAGLLGRLERGMRLKQVRTGKLDSAARAAILLRPRPGDRRRGVRRRRGWAFPTTALCGSATR
jgi:peptide chain release factor 3